MSRPLRTGEFRGPGWVVELHGVTHRIDLRPEPEQPFRFTGQLAVLDLDLEFRLEYTLAAGSLQLRAAICNRADHVFAPTRCGLKLGLDTYMVRAPDWDQQYFPTLLRCESSHFWGYCMSPLGRIFRGIAAARPGGRLEYGLQLCLLWH